MERCQCGAPPPFPRNPDEPGKDRTGPFVCSRCWWRAQLDAYASGRTLAREVGGFLDKMRAECIRKSRDFDDHAKRVLGLG